MTGNHSNPLASKPALAALRGEWRHVAHARALALAHWRIQRAATELARSPEGPAPPFRSPTATLACHRELERAQACVIGSLRTLTDPSWDGSQPEYEDAVDYFLLAFRASSPSPSPAGALVDGILASRTAVAVALNAGLPIRPGCAERPVLLADLIRWSASPTHPGHDALLAAARKIRAAPQGQTLDATAARALSKEARAALAAAAATALPGEREEWTPAKVPDQPGMVTDPGPDLDPDLLRASSEQSR